MLSEEGRELLHGKLREVGGHVHGQEVQPALLAVLGQAGTKGEQGHYLGPGHLSMKKRGNLQDADKRDYSSISIGNSDVNLKSIHTSPW